jgi:hypothetical protein
MKLGVIEEGKLQGKKILLEPRTNLPDNEYLVEKGTFFNGSAMFQKACLICEEFINSTHQCPSPQPSI